MNKSGKIITAGVIASIILAWTVIRAKKNYKKLSAETVENENNTIKGEVNLPESVVKDLLYSVWNKEGDDVVEIDGIITGRVQNVIHIKERFDDRLGRNVVEFLFEAPENIYSKGRAMGEFVKQVRGEWDPEKEELVGDSFISKISKIMEAHAGEVSPNIIKSSVEGYVYGTWKEERDGEMITNKAMVSVSKKTYEHNYMNPEHTKVTEWINDLNSELKKDKNSVLETTSDCYFTPIRAIACIKVIVDGLTLEAAKAIIDECLKEEFTVHTSAGNYVYDRFLFYDPQGINEQTVFEVVNDERGYSIESTDLVDEFNALEEVDDEKTSSDIFERAGIDAEALKEAVA